MIELEVWSSELLNFRASFPRVDGVEVAAHLDEASNVAQTGAANPEDVVRGGPGHPTA